MFKRFLSAIVALLAFAASSQAAISAYTADQLFFGGEITEFNMKNYESLIDVANPGSTAGVIDVGDKLRGIFKITGTQNQNLSEQKELVDFELTGVFEAQISAIPSYIPGGALFELVPSATFTSVYGAGAMIAFYEDFTPNFSAAAASEAIAELTATDGDLWLVLGSTGTWGTDYYWAANGSVTPGVANFTASLEILVNNTAFLDSEFIAINQAPPLGFGGGGGLNLGLENILNAFALKGNTDVNANDTIPYDLESNDPLKAKAVPEPASLAVWSLLSVGGLALARRRRRG